MSYRVRKAEPEDSEFLARIIEGAVRSHLPQGIFDRLIPDPDDRADVLEWLVLSDLRSACHHSGFRVVEWEGEPVSAATAFDPGAPDFAGLGAALADAFEGLGLPEEDLARAFRDFAVYETCAPEQPPETWVVEYVCTLPERRRRGCARAALTQLLSEGRGLGLPEAQISFFIGNEPARRAYESIGFKLRDERRNPVFERAFCTPGMTRLARPL